MEQDSVLEALKTATPEQARILHALLSAWCEYMRSHPSPMNEDDVMVLSLLPAGRELLNKLDAAANSAQMKS